jgi:hypothetical protein
VPVPRWPSTSEGPTISFKGAPNRRCARAYSGLFFAIDTIAPLRDTSQSANNTRQASGLRSCSNRRVTHLWGGHDLQ